MYFCLNGSVKTTVLRAGTYCGLVCGCNGHSAKLYVDYVFSPVRWVVGQSLFYARKLRHTADKRRGGI